MKKILALVLTVALLLCTSVQAVFADELENVVIGDYFYALSDFVDSKGESLSGSIDNEYYRLAGFQCKDNSHKKYLEVKIDDGDGVVTIRVKPGSNITSNTKVSGTVTIMDVQSRDRYTATFAFNIPPMEQANILYVDTKEFELPDSYHLNKVRFRTVDKEDIGTLYARFAPYGGGEIVAYFDVRIVEQPSLTLAHNENAIVDLMKKYQDANLEFLTWDATPKFQSAGTLGIVMDKSEFLYSRSADNKLTLITGKYNSDRETLEFKTDTLGAYVISDIKLSGAGTASSVSEVAPASSVAPPPASSSKPASSVAPPPPASSSKPASSSAVVAPESSSEASSEEPSSSEPEPEPEPPSSEPEPESSSTAAKPSKDEDEGSLPILPVAIGIGVVAVGGVAAFFFFNKKGGSKNYDTWDD